MDTYRVLALKFPQIKWPTTWKGLFQLVETCTHEIKVKMIVWKKSRSLDQNQHGWK